MSSVVMATGPRIHVLSIDGGGVRGIIPAEILAYITLKTKLPVYEMFDLVAGTSTGGIIALGLGTRCKNGIEPYTPPELSDLFMSHAAEIFPKPSFPALRQLLGPKYPAEPLERILVQYFGSAMLSSAMTPLLISSYDLVSQQPFFFKSHKIETDASYDAPVARVARATSAAPTYFPPLLVPASESGWNQELCLIDGGVCVNNPAMAAYAEAKMLYHPIPQAEYLVVSVGTGDRKDQLHYRGAASWGLLKWGKL
ncbi:MAG: patatin-like phospholipase family protein, partial [Terriglobales bacterium]